MKINAEVKEIRFRNDSNGWTVILCTDTDKNGFSAVGVMPNINSGEQAELEGTWTEHPIYGRQFRVDSYRSILPKGRQALLAYLSSGFIKGIRESTARLIVDRFGEDTFDIIKNHPEQLIKISGIGPKKAQQIHESYLESITCRILLSVCRSWGFLSLWP
ncbi:MAG: helix-hairpin-helix domain-containing protein [Clostridium sp.]|nr:helix-hairpin-helix domain-containing protein [Clostridium sp.]